MRFPALCYCFSANVSLILLQKNVDTLKKKKKLVKCTVLLPVLFQTCCLVFLQVSVSFLASAEAMYTNDLVLKGNC